MNIQTSSADGTDDTVSPDAVLAFWFDELKPRDWFRQSTELDDDITRRFGKTQARAARDGLPAWRIDAQGRLAEIIVLDQFSRNIHRETPQAYENDVLARRLAHELIAHELDTALTTQQRIFAYMPFMHSECLDDQHRSVALFEHLGEAAQIKHARGHFETVERFGRFPHRNTILGRSNTPAESAFLEKPGSNF